MIFPNPFVYSKVYDSDINNANIPTLLEEQYSQCGEDIIILSMIKALELNFQEDSCVCIEIGANHSFAGSNTYLIGKELGIKSILVEANPSLIPDLKKARPNDIVINKAVIDKCVDFIDLFVSNQNELSSLNKDFVETWHNGEVGLKEVCKVPAIRVNTLLSNYANNKEILLLSIDVEGMDLRIAQDLNFWQWRPIFVQMEPSEHFLQGEGDKMVAYMKANDYFLISKTKVNLIFIDKKKLFSCLGFFEIEPMKIIEEKINIKEERKLKMNDFVKSKYKDIEIISDKFSKEFGAPLSNWKPDEGFISKVLDCVDSLNEKCIVSFDIFDTAITRDFESPADLFCEVERILLNEIGESAKGFAAARELAEKQAREKHYNKSKLEEINFSHIYEELAVLRPDLKNLEYISGVEIRVEKESLFVVPDILNLTKKLLDRGIPYIFVSDMYLPKDFLADILSSLGYEKWDEIFVSSEMEVTKATGKIWDKVKGRVGEKIKIIHIGDDKHSDVINPLKKGLITFEYSRAISERKVGANNNAYLVPYSKFKRRFTLFNRCDPLAQINSDEESWFRLGRTLGGVLLCTFVNWLAKRVTDNKIEKIFFCARDGYLVQQAWIAAGFDKKIPVNYSYLSISRSVLNIASGIAESSAEGLSRNLLSFLSSSAGKTTVESALERIDILNFKEVRDDAINEFGSLDVILEYPINIEKFENFLQNKSKLVYEKLFGKYEICLKYLEQEGIFEPCKFAIVDMGWHGTMQKSLKLLINSVGGKSKIHGFYYGLWRGALGNRYASGPMEALLANEFQKPSDVIGLQQGVALLEQMHSAPHGSTIGYEMNKNGAIIPVYKNNEMEMKQHAEITSFFQKGALETVMSFYSYNNDYQSEIDPAIALAGIESLTLSPSKEELNLLSSIGHCATFDHSSHEPILVEKIPNDLIEIEKIILHSEWKFGQLKLWWINSNENQRNLLRHYINSNFGYLNKKINEQFNG